VNSSFVECTTPLFDDDVSTIYKEYAPISVSMNGNDFGDDISTADFTFTGTAPYLSFFTIILLLAVIALFGFALAKYLEKRNEKAASEAAAGDNN
jgi:hypothetical protein